MPKLEFPAYFEDGTVGVRATEPINHREAFIGVPFCITMNLQGAREDEVLGKIIEENPKVLGASAPIAAQMVLTLYVIHEHLKGADSFWKPYIDLMALSNQRPSCAWSEDLIDGMQDIKMKKELENLNKGLGEAWEELSKALADYQHIFPPNVVNYAMFEKFFVQVCRRIDSVNEELQMLIPMVDCLNLSDSSISKELINTQLHLEANPISDYHATEKYMNDYSSHFAPEEYKGDK